MKTNPSIRRTGIVLYLLLFSLLAESQGRVVINEYLPWPSNACGSTSEFVELLNFGPGPQNIGCYILTNGTYSVTIPPNTILQPGQFYLIAGKDTLNQGCGNSSQSMIVNLNWNQCNCTNVPIPATGEGFMPDGGLANVNMVLLNSSLQVVDAVTRSLPVPSSNTITTSGTSLCAPQTFNLNNYSINYETLGMSTGNANSFARRIDGDCGWVKTPQQTAQTTNNANGNTTDITYLFSILNATECNGSTGRVQIYVRHSDAASLFPMDYTIATDINQNGMFDANDNYVTKKDSTAPDILIDSLPLGHYRITVGSNKGCYLQNFDFNILPCTVPLSSQLLYFRKKGTSLEWATTNTAALNRVILQGSKGNEQYADIQVFVPGNNLNQAFSSPILTSYSAYRVKLVRHDGSVFYSPVLYTGTAALPIVEVAPNPATTPVLRITLQSAVSAVSTYRVYNSNGCMVQTGRWDVKAGTGSYALGVQSLPAGVFLLQIGGDKGTQPICLRFVKP